MHKFLLLTTQQDDNVNAYSASTRIKPECFQFDSDYIVNIHFVLQFKLSV